MKLERVTPADAPALLEIYGPYVENTAISFEYAVPSVEEFTRRIRDTGIGISPEDLPRIFERGYTGCNGRADKKATGLGLYLCRRICANLGHGISAESAPGIGTLVRLDLTQTRGPFE